MLALNFFSLFQNFFVLVFTYTNLLYGFNFILEIFIFLDDLLIEALLCFFLGEIETEIWTKN